MKFGLEGIIRLTTRVGVTDEDPWGQVTGESEFHNEILDSGLDLLANNSLASPLTYCRLGTSATPVSVGQTALGNQTAYSSTKSPGGDNFSAMTASTPRYNRVVFRRRFAAGSLNGTYSEIGFGPEPTGNLFNRALISPTKTVLSTETLDVEYELRTYIPSADVTGTVVLNGVTHTYTLRPVAIDVTFVSYDRRPWAIRGGGVLDINSQITAYTGGALVAQTGYEPTYTAYGAGQNATLTLPDAYAPGSGFRKVRFSWPLDDLNVAGGSFTHLKVGLECASWQIAFSPAVTKTAAKTFSLDLGVTFSRYTP